jgi:transposase-like protein
VRKLLLAAVSAAKRMGQAFSDDLRRRILQTYERENISQPALAQRFGVSYDCVKKIRKQQLRSGQTERIPQSRHGRDSQVTEEVQQQLRAGGNNDRTDIAQRITEGASPMPLKRQLAANGTCRAKTKAGR